MVVVVLAMIVKSAATVSLVPFSSPPPVPIRPNTFSVRVNNLVGTVPSSMTALYPVNGSNWDTNCLTDITTRIATCDMADRSILIDLYTATSMDGWTVNTGWMSPSSPCTWYGVTCSSNGASVIGLSLPGNNLGGTLPPSMGDLSALTYV